MHDIFFFTDVHGMYDLYRAVINFCKAQDPEATIIFGGDACDRGPEGYRIMKELLDNPYVIYLKGNHEDIFCKAAHEIKLTFHPYDKVTRERVHTFLNCTKGFDYRCENIKLSLFNGGLETLTDWIMDGMNMDFINRIEHLPLTFSYNNCDFCHSAGSYQVFKEVADAEYNNMHIDELNEEKLLWGRVSLNHDWKENRIAVFGHTPTPYLNEYIKFKPEENWEVSPVMFNNHIPNTWKLDMDTGAAFTGRLYVLNVLTMQIQGFEDIDINASLKVHKVEKIDCIQM